MALLSLPKFSGEDPESWICSMEEFFYNNPIPLEQYVSIGSQHLVGIAQVWFTSNQHKFAMDWCGFVYHLLGEFENSESFQARFKSASVQTLMDDGPAKKEGDAISDNQICVSSVLLPGNESPTTPDEESIAASFSQCYPQISSSTIFGQDQDFQTPTIHTKNRNNIHTHQMFDDIHKEEHLENRLWNYGSGSILYMNFFCVRYDDFVTKIEVPIAWNIYDVNDLLKVLIPQTSGLEVVTYELLSLDNVAVVPHSSTLVAFNYSDVNRTGTGNQRRAERNKVWFIPVLDHPLSSSRYYVIHAKGKYEGQTCTCSKENDMVTVCFCMCGSDVKPGALNSRDIYQQMEIFKEPRGIISDSGFSAKSVAPDGSPPRFLR